MVESITEGMSEKEISEFSTFLEEFRTPLAEKDISKIQVKKPGLNCHPRAEKHQLIQLMSDKSERWLLTDRGEEYLDGQLLTREIDFSAVKKDSGAPGMAREFARLNPICYSEAGAWYMWSHKRKFWQRVDEITILALFDRMSKDEIDTRSQAVSEFKQALKIVGRNKWNEVRPADPNPRRSWVQFGDEIIDTATGEPHRPEPKYFITNIIPHKLGRSKKTPKIDKLLFAWMDGDRKKVHTLKEIFAYCLLSDMPIHRAFAFLGPGCNGKSTCIELLARLLGRNNTTSFELNSLLNNSFHSSKLEGRLAAFTADMNFATLRNTAILKQLTGGDMISGNRKYQNEFDFYNHAKLFLVGNTLPATTDRTEGFYRRFLILRFERKFRAEKKVLDKIPESELENFCTQLCFLLKPLVDRGRFKHGDTTEEKEEAYEANSSPIQTFLNECCKLVPQSETPKFMVHQRFESWAKKQGLRKYGFKEFNQELKELCEPKGLTDKPKKVFVEGDERVWWHWVGLQLN